MSLTYRLILRPNMTKGAAKDSKLFYGQLRSQQQINFKKLCEMVSGHCTATKGEVELVIDGLIYVLEQQLAMGSIIQMGDFGKFRIAAGSTGTATSKEFDPALFKKGRIVFTPSVSLKEMLSKLSYEKLAPFQEPTIEGAGGSDSESPDEI